MKNKRNQNLTSEQKIILFDEGTERPGSSELNHEKREGSYHCVNCDLKLFNSSIFDLNLVEAAGIEPASANPLPLVLHV